MIMHPGSLLWFARHELRLAFRDIRMMLTAGRPTRLAALLITVFIGVGLMHLLAYGVIASWVRTHPEADKPTLLMLTGYGLLFSSVMASQALESVTRAYYGRGDLELILSSPASSRKLFAVRAAGIAVVTMVLACFLASPLINVLIFLDGMRWFAAYAVFGALSAFTAALGILITLALFRWTGPKRTRLISQIVAAIVGAGFIIGIQLATILYYNSYSRFKLFQSAEVIAAAPNIDSVMWVPARAAMGEPLPLLITILVGMCALILAIWLGANSFARYAISTAGVLQASGAHVRSSPTFRSQSQKQALRVKEWRLLWRDPWLLSQMLMQILYLLPPALMLWVSFGDSTGTAYVVVVPVLVMAAGQLAGGLSWLAISGEDAPDLVASAPVGTRTALTAKIEAVLLAVGAILMPLLVIMAFDSLRVTGVTLTCSALSAASATAIQLWFRTISKRSIFRRRQTASRLSTLCEALVSIMWAGTAAVWATESVSLAIIPAILALFILLGAWLLSPKK